MTKERKPLSMPFYVIVFDGDEKVFEGQFDQYPIIIGRSSRCEIPLKKYKFISRNHAQFIERDGTVYIQDMGSSNGFKIKGEKIDQAPIHGQEEIKIGPLLFHTKIVKRSKNKDTPQNIADQPTLIQTRTGSSDATVINGSTKPDATSVQVKTTPKKKVTKRTSRAPLDVNQGPALQSTESSGEDFRIKTTMELMNSEGELRPHPFAKFIQPSQKVLEGIITWKGQVYEIAQFRAGEKVYVGNQPGARLKIPSINRNKMLAYYDGKNTRCFVPQKSEIRVTGTDAIFSKEELFRSNALVKSKYGYSLQLGNEEICSISLDDTVKLHLRYVPAPRMLSKKQIAVPDEEFKKATTFSSLFHLTILIVALVFSPPNTAPVIKNVPKRYARLLLEPPRQIIKQKPKPPEPKKIEPPKKKEVKVVKKTPPKKKIQPKPKKVVLKKNKVLKKLNEKPPENVVEKPKESVDIKNVGALAALNSLSPKVKNTPSSININKDAGGKNSLRTGGVLSNLKTKNGEQSIGGDVSVETKGLGFGTGKGYGTQGINGKAGTRKVAGAVVGEPKVLKSIKKEGLTRAQVMAVVEKNLGAIQSCYEEALLGSPNLSGRVEFEWFIKPNGRVKMARVSKADIKGGDALNKCVIGVFRTMKFPVAKNGLSTQPKIGFPFGRL